MKYENFSGFYSTDCFKLSKLPKKQRQPTPQRRTRGIQWTTLPLGTGFWEERTGPRNTCTHLGGGYLLSASSYRETNEKIRQEENQAQTFTVDETWCCKRKDSPKNSMYNANTWVSTPNGIANFFIFLLASIIGISEDIGNIKSVIVSSWTTPTPALDKDRLVWTYARKVRSEAR